MEADGKMRALVLREAEAHQYFADNADLRMTTGDHAKRAANLRAIAGALSPVAGPVTDEMVPPANYPDDGNGDDDAFNAGWNACRAALLAALESKDGH